MTHKTIMLCLVLVLVLCGSAFASPASDSVNNFAFSAGKILGEGGGNYFFSPFSIISAFGMAYAGAAGDTAKELELVLGFNPEIHASLGGLAKELRDGHYLASANKVWIKDGLKLRWKFGRTLAKDYNSPVQELDFRNDTKASQQAINDWVSLHTEGKINDIIKSLDPETRMILTNAVYFRAEWSSVFDKDRTAPKPFYYGGEESGEVPMMMQRDDFYYTEADGVKVIRLPYEGRRCSMIVALPPLGEEFSPTPEMFSGWLRAMEKYDVDLWLPKFRTEERYELNSLFRALGVNLAFTDAADFSGMTEDERLMIDAVVHQTFIDVDEEKTEAAAATVMMMVTTAMPVMRPKVEFHADHPFTYFIVDDDTDTILFMGRQTFR